MAKSKRSWNNWLICAFLLVIIVGLIWQPATVREGFENDASCSSCSGQDGMTHDEKGKLLPVMDPLYNAREWCKQCVLLEDHLTHPKKSCKDCITKHCLTMEALAEEACTLDKNGKHKDLLGGLADQCRAVQKRFWDGEDKHVLAQELRRTRKKLMPKCRTHF